MDIAVIIVNYNCGIELLECVQSIESSLEEIQANGEVIIVDNDSKDNSIELIEKNAPRTRIVKLKANLGFAVACNAGAQATDARLLLFLNPDTIMNPHALQSMIKEFDSDSLPKIVGCTLNYQDGSLQYSIFVNDPSFLSVFLDRALIGSLIKKINPRWSFPGQTYLTDKEKYDHKLKPKLLSGACLMLSHKAFELIGGFDENFFMYYEDVDLCRRIREAGGEVIYVPTEPVIHYQGNSAKLQSMLFRASIVLDSIEKYYRKYYGNWAALGLIICFIADILGMIPSVFAWVFLAGKRDKTSKVLKGNICSFMCHLKRLMKGSFV